MGYDGKLDNASIHTEIIQQYYMTLFEPTMKGKAIVQWTIC